MLQVFADELSGAAIVFDESHFRRATRECLDTNRPRTCAQIQQARAYDTRRENVEERFAQPIRSRAYVQACERLQAAAFVLSRDDSHPQTSDLRPQTSDFVLQI